MPIIPLLLQFGSYIRMGSMQPSVDADDVKEVLVHKPVVDASTSETDGLLRDASTNQETLSAATFRKLHWKILPFTALIVMLSYLDRGNLGFVAADVCTELDMNHTRYGLGVSLFGVGYMIFQVHSNHFCRKFGPTLWFAFLLVSWGAVAASFSFVQNRLAFYFLRFFLGVAEGGTFPGVWYFLTIFFPPDRLTFPYATIESAIAIASPLAACIAAGLLSLDGVIGFSGWRLLFFVEGILPILYGGILFWILPPTIDRASFLSAEEKECLKEKLPVGDGESKTLYQEVCKVVNNKNFWIISFNGIIRSVLITATFYWTTLIIDEMLNGDDDDDDDDTCASSKSTSITSVALTAIPFTICAAFSLWFGHVTANVKNRPRLAGWIMASSGLFLYGWVIFKHISFVCALLSFSLGISFFVSLDALIVGLVGSYYDKETKATALALFNTLNGVGWTVGPIIIGIVVDHQGYGIAVTCLSIAALIGGMALLNVTDPLITQKHDSFHDEDTP